MVTKNRGPDITMESPALLEIKPGFTRAAHGLMKLTSLLRVPEDGWTKTNLHLQLDLGVQWYVSEGQAETNLNLGISSNGKNKSSQKIYCKKPFLFREGFFIGSISCPSNQYTKNS